MYQYSKLLGALKEHNLTQDEFADKLGISATSLRAKLKGKTQFKKDEIEKSMSVLSLPMDEVAVYFFSR